MKTLEKYVCDICGSDRKINIDMGIDVLHKNITEGYTIYKHRYDICDDCLLRSANIVADHDGKNPLILHDCSALLKKESINKMHDKKDIDKMDEFCRSKHDGEMAKLNSLLDLARRVVVTSYPVTLELYSYNRFNFGVEIVVRDWSTCDVFKMTFEKDEWQSIEGRISPDAYGITKYAMSELWRKISSYVINASKIYGFTETEDNDDDNTQKIHM